MSHPPQPSTVSRLLLRPVNALVLVTGLATGILLASLTAQPDIIASAQEPEPYCGDGTCDPTEDWSWCAADCLTTCDGANWCTEGVGDPPGACPDFTPYDGWVYAPGSPACSTSGCCVQITPPDSAPPVTEAHLSGTLGNDPWYTSPVVVTLTATDDFSGVAATYLDDLPYTGPVTYAAEGMTTITFWSVDNADKYEDPQSLDFFIDTVAPGVVIAIPSPNSWVGGVVTLAGYAMDETSGLAAVEVSFDGGLTWLPAMGTDTWTYVWDVRALPVNIVQARGIDQAGNISDPLSIAVSIDNSGPFFEVGPFPREYCFTCSGPLTFTMTAFDEQSRINNSAIVVKQNGKDIRVLQAPGGELRNTPVVWDGRDSHGNQVPVGDYQLLFYTANYAGLFGSFGASIRVVDTATATTPELAPVMPVEPPTDTSSWLVTPIPPTPSFFIPASGITSGPVSVNPQVAAVPGVSSQMTALAGALGGASTGNTGVAVPGIAALLAAMTAYIAAQQVAGSTRTRTADPTPSPGSEDTSDQSTTTTQAGEPTQVDPNVVGHVFSDPALLATFFGATRSLYYFSLYGGAGASLKGGFINWPQKLIAIITDISGDKVNILGHQRVPANASNVQWLAEPSLAIKVGGRLAGASLAAGLLDLVIPGENPALFTLSDITGQAANLSGLARLPALLKDTATLRQAVTINPGLGSVLGQLAMVLYGGYEFIDSRRVIVEQNEGKRPWNERERWGEALQMIGGGALATAGIFGGIAALGVAAFALPALPFIAIAGGALIATGWAVNNWDKFEAGAAAWGETIKGVGALGQAIIENPKKTVLEPFNYWVTRPINNMATGAAQTVTAAARNLVKTAVQSKPVQAIVKTGTQAAESVKAVAHAVTHPVQTIQMLTKTVAQSKPVQTLVKTVTQTTKTVQTTVKNVVKVVTQSKPVQAVVRAVTQPARTVQTLARAITQPKPVQAVAKSLGNFVKGLFGRQG